MMMLMFTGAMEGFSLASPRFMPPAGLRATSTVRMNVGDEAMLQDAVAEIFDSEECAVDAETAEERASCMEGAPAEPYDYAGSQAPTKTDPLPGVVSAPKSGNALDECLVESENAGEVDACKSDYTGSGAAVADIEEDGCEMIGETKDEVWFACKDGADSDDVECIDTSFGTGGGPGILPQDGQKLCKADKPK